MQRMSTKIRKRHIYFVRGRHLVEIHKKIYEKHSLYGIIHLNAAEIFTAAQERLYEGSLIS